MQPKLELDIKPEISVFKHSDSSKRRASNSCGDSGNLQITKVDQKPFSSAGIKRNHRTNGLSAMDQSLMAKMTDGEWDSTGKAQLLGPALTELAQKLERSNALQILPIRPALVGSPDEDSDNHYIPKKKRKTEYPTSVNVNQHYHQKTGPFDTRSLAVGPPNDIRAKKLLQEDANPANKAPIKAHSAPLQISKLARTDMNWKPLVSLGCCKLTQ